MTVFAVTGDCLPARRAAVPPTPHAGRGAGSGAVCSVFGAGRWASASKERINRGRRIEVTRYCSITLAPNSVGDRAKGDLL